MLKEAKKIWETCFSDSPEEINFYFQHIFREEHWKQFTDHLGETRASLHLNPYTLKLGKQSYSYPYVVGVATLPEHRGQGYMTKLLLQEFYEMKNQGLDFCFLKPINPTLYRNFGFEYISSLEEYEFPTALLGKTTKNIDMDIIEVTRDNMEILVEQFLKIYSIAMLGKFSYFAREKEDFLQLFEELFLNRGRIYLFTQNQRPSAYLLMSLEEDRISIRECFANNARAYQDIFFFLKSYREYYSKIQIFAPVGSLLEFYLENQLEVQKKSHPFMMGRILNVQSFLKKCELFAPSVKILIEDPVIPDNRGFYFLDEEVSYSDEISDEYDFKIGIRELVPLCFGFFSFQEMLKLGKLKLHSVDNLALLEELFLKKTTYFHAYW